MRMPNSQYTEQRFIIPNVVCVDATPTISTYPGHTMSSRQATKQEGGSNQSSDSPNKEKVTFDDGPIPDGGYSWVIVVCQFVSQMATWGMITPYGVFISWFVSQNTFPGATSIQFGWIAGLLGAAVFGMSPISNYISKLLPLRGQFHIY